VIIFHRTPQLLLPSSMCGSATLSPSAGTPRASAMVPGLACGTTSPGNLFCGYVLIASVRVRRDLGDGPNPDYAATIPHGIYSFYQLTFAVRPFLLTSWLHIWLSGINGPCPVCILSLDGDAGHHVGCPRRTYVVPSMAGIHLPLGHHRLRPHRYPPARTRHNTPHHRVSSPKLPTL
jgi:hypothetical protein